MLLATPRIALPELPLPTASPGTQKIQTERLCSDFGHSSGKAITRVIVEELGGMRQLIALVVYDIRDIQLFSLFESINKSMSTNKIKPIDVTFLLKNTSIEVVNIKLPEFRTFELVNF
jgi:hypothetical protein